MIYELKDTSKVQTLFDGWQETLIYSCLQKVMGEIYVTDLDNPQSAFAFVGDFGFFAGKPDKELVLSRPDGIVFLIPQDEIWASLVEECFHFAKRVSRYAIKKDTEFDEESLQKIAGSLPNGYTMRNIDSEIYDMCLQDPFIAKFVSSFESKEKFLKFGRGVVVLKDGKIVSGASSYTSYIGGIEIQVNTVKGERRKGLASVACASLILSCLKEGLYPSWDAKTMTSVHLAEKLGYEFDHEYVAYEVG